MILLWNALLQILIFSKQKKRESDGHRLYYPKKSNDQLKNHTCKNVASVIKKLQLPLSNAT